MRPKRHNLTRHKSTPPLIPLRTEWWSFKQRCQIKRRQRIENNYFVRCVGVDGLVEREIGGAVVEGGI